MNVTKDQTLVGSMCHSWVFEWNMIFLGTHGTGCSRLVTQEVTKGAHAWSIPALTDACCASGPADAGGIGHVFIILWRELAAKPELTLLIGFSQIRV